MWSKQRPRNILLAAFRFKDVTHDVQGTIFPAMRLASAMPTQVVGKVSYGDIRIGATIHHFPLSHSSGSEALKGQGTAHGSELPRELC